VVAWSGSGLKSRIEANRADPFVNELLSLPGAARGGTFQVVLLGSLNLKTRTSEERDDFRRRFSFRCFR
jgi:hypothetical protein